VAGEGWVHGLELAAVAVVATAVWQMARTLARGVVRGAIAALAATVVLAWGGPAAQVLVIGAGGLLGWRLLTTAEAPAARPALEFGVPRSVAIGALCLAMALLGALPLADRATSSHAVALTSGMYQSGALVFGGGHVVLPLLQARTVAAGWVSQGDFVAGYGAAQAVPGPLFTFAGYLGAVSGPEPNGVPGAALALVAIFLPGLLLVVGAAPFWTLLRARRGSAAVLAGVNAAVVGLLLAALYRPLVSTAVSDAGDVAIALAALGLLAVLRAPPWTVVAACAVAGQLLT
jgi:chromate transporter